MTRIGLLGASGRMGRAIAAILQDSTEAQFAGLVRGEEASGLGEAATCWSISASTRRPESEVAVAAGKPIVIGTTGLGAGHQAAIDEVAKHIPVLQAANMSLGFNLLAHLVREAAARLGEDWDVEIVEMHHRHKADAAVGHGVDARRRGGGGARRRARRGQRPRPRRPDRTARARPYRLRGAARRLGRRRPFGDLRDRGRKARASATAPRAATSSPAARSARRSGSRTGRRAATRWPTCSASTWRSRQPGEERASKEMPVVRGIYDLFATGDALGIGAMSPDMVWNEAEQLPAR